MKRIDPLKLLSRSDKWYLGGNSRLLWAPEFPVWLDKPGFWDKAHYYNIAIEPVFTWTLLDEKGKEIPIRQTDRQWNPSRLQCEYVSTDSNRQNRLKITEQKCCSPGDTLSSTIRISNLSSRRRRLHLVAWTIQPSYPSKGEVWIDNLSINHSNISYEKNLRSGDKPLQKIGCTLGIKGGIDSYSINLSEGSAVQPHWRLTPFDEKFNGKRFNNERKLNGINADGLIYIALHRKIDIPARASKNISIIFSVGSSIDEAGAIFRSSQTIVSLPAHAEKSWQTFFAGVPYFSCSDKYFTRYYWYRWYGLHLSTLQGGEGNYNYPVVCEGIGYFRAPITYSAMCHMLENRWMNNPKLAQGSLLTFIHNQRDDGGFRGYIDLNHYRQEMFYHGNWGKSVLELYRCHPDKEFLANAYDGLVKYAEYFDRERDSEKSGLYDIDNHYETGQEYMHRYLAVDPNADKDNWGEVFRLKGVDVTVYIYELKKSLAKIAAILGRPVEEISKWKQGAEKIRGAILDQMWDPEVEMFFDLNPGTHQRTGVRAAVCFYPYMTDIATKEHLPGLKRHLLNPSEFWTAFPVPSSSVDDEYFSADAHWKGKRMNCPWNGRVWPMTNSHIAEALAISAYQFQDTELRIRTVEFITKYIRMLFSDGDSTKPNCYEHYNPFTGQASEYRGINDYQHSWVVDLILKYVAGIRPIDEGILIDPFPFNSENVIVDNVTIRGITLKVECKKSHFVVSVNHRKVIKSKIGEPIIIQ
ncbi:MAG: trehalase family glycosidase [Bacteroidota bacterium]